MYTHTVILINGALHIYETFVWLLNFKYLIERSVYFNNLIRRFYCGIKARNEIIF